MYKAPIFCDAMPNLKREDRSFLNVLKTSLCVRICKTFRSVLFRVYVNVFGIDCYYSGTLAITCTSIALHFHKQLELS